MALGKRCLFDHNESTYINYKSEKWKSYLVVWWLTQGYDLVVFRPHEWHEALGSSLLAWQHLWPFTQNLRVQEFYKIKMYWNFLCEWKIPLNWIGSMYLRNCENSGSLTSKFEFKIWIDVPSLSSLELHWYIHFNWNLAF